MNTLIEQIVRFLSKSNSPYIHEKSLTPDEIEDLMDKGEEVADSIANDFKFKKEICNQQHHHKFAQFELD